MLHIPPAQRRRNSSVQYSNAAGVMGMMPTPPPGGMPSYQEGAPLQVGPVAGARADFSITYPQGGWPREISCRPSVPVDSVGMTATSAHELVTVPMFTSCIRHDVWLFQHTPKPKKITLAPTPSPSPAPQAMDPNAILADSKAPEDMSPDDIEEMIRKLQVCDRCRAPGAAVQARVAGAGGGDWCRWVQTYNVVVRKRRL